MIVKSNLTNRKRAHNKPFSLIKKMWELSHRKEGELGEMPFAFLHPHACVSVWCVASQPNATCFRCLQAPAAALKLLVWTERGEDLGRGSGTTEDGGGGVGGGRVRRVQPQFRATRRQRAINCCKRQETRGRAPAPPPSPWPCPPPSCWCCTNNPCKGRWLFRFVPGFVGFHVFKSKTYLYWKYCLLESTAP